MFYIVLGRLYIFLNKSIYSSRVVCWWLPLLMLLLLFLFSVKRHPPSTIQCGHQPPQHTSPITFISFSGGAFTPPSTDTWSLLLLRLPTQNPIRCCMQIRLYIYNTVHSYKNTTTSIGNMNGLDGRSPTLHIV